MPRVYARSSRATPHKPIDVESIKGAVKAVIRRMPVRKAAAKFGVTKSAVYRYVVYVKDTIAKSNTSVDTVLDSINFRTKGGQTALSAELE